MLEVLKKQEQIDFRGTLEVKGENYEIYADFVWDKRLEDISGLIVIYLRPHIRKDGTVEQEEEEIRFETDVETFQELLEFLGSEEFKQLWKKEDGKAIRQTINSILEGKKTIPCLKT